MKNQLFLSHKVTLKRFYMLVALLTICLFANGSLFAMSAVAQSLDSQGPLGSAETQGSVSPANWKLADSNQGPLLIGPGVTIPVMTWNVPAGTYEVNVSSSAVVSNNTMLACDIAPSHIAQDFIVPGFGDDQSGTLELNDVVDLPKGGKIVLECTASSASPAPIQIDPGDLRTAISPK